jgi:hypothetical protein
MDLAVAADSALYVVEDPAGYAGARAHAGEAVAAVLMRFTFSSSSGSFLCDRCFGVHSSSLRQPR